VFHFFILFYFLILLFRRKYELQQFLDSEENLICPFIPSHARTTSSSQSSSSSYNPPQEKKRYDKLTTRNRIGLSFRNSWGRKDSESKSTKKSNSLVMFHFITSLKLVNAINNAIYVESSDRLEYVFCPSNISIFRFCRNGPCNFFVLL